MLNLETPPGFRGLDTDVPVTVYYRHLPHWRQEAPRTLSHSDSLTRYRSASSTSSARFAETGTHVIPLHDPIRTGNPMRDRSR